MLAAVGAPGFNPLVPPTPPGLEVAEPPAEIALGPIEAVVTGLASQVNILITCALPLLAKKSTKKIDIKLLRKIPWSLINQIYRIMAALQKAEALK